jgi:hypothetical protein
VNEGKSNNGRLALISALVAAGGLYDIATSTAAPGATTEFLRWILLACLLVGLVGWLVEYRSQS